MMTQPNRPRKTFRDRNTLHDRDQALPELWARYKAAPTTALRNKLIEYYLPLVRLIAQRLAVRLPREVDLDDLISAGLFGLMDAINAFDPNRGVKFQTYCGLRVRGAMIDHLRAMDWAPRQLRACSTQISELKHTYQTTRGRPPTDAEIAQHLGVDANHYTRIDRDLGPMRLVSIHQKRYETDAANPICDAELLPDKRQISPLTVAMRADLKALITRNLSRSERLLIILYYYENMTMKQIGQTLDLSESRVSQMHSSILARLRTCVTNPRDHLETAVTWQHH